QVRPHDGDRRGRLERRVLPRPAVELDRGDGARDDASGRRDAGDQHAARARHGEQLRVEVDGEVGPGVRIDVADFRGVHRSADRIDLLEAQDGHRREERRVDVPPVALDDRALRRRGRRVRARRDPHDLPVAHDDRARRNFGARDGMDRDAGERERARCRRLSRGQRHRPEKHQQAGGERLHGSTSRCGFAASFLSLSLSFSLSERRAFAFATRSARSFSSAAPPARSAARSKYFRPSIQVSSATLVVESGSPLQTTKSPSLPTSSEPTRSAIPSWRAGFDVTKASASAGGTLPYLTAFAASMLSRRASSSESELNETVTPRSRISGNAYGIASTTSYL